MKKTLLTAVFCALFLIGSTAFAYPEGEITIYNASSKDITAQLSSVGSFTLGSNQQRSVAYRTLSYACAGNPTSCTARFFVNNAPVGSAVINTVTGKLTSKNLSMKVRTAKDPANVVRSVVIK